jgi:hypothetical protein
MKAITPLRRRRNQRGDHPIVASVPFADPWPAFSITLSSHHADLYFNEIDFRWSQRVLTRYAMRRTRQGREVVKPKQLWSRIAPALQLT